MPCRDPANEIARIERRDGTRLWDSSFQPQGFHLTTLFCPPSRFRRFGLPSLPLPRRSYQRIATWSGATFACDALGSSFGKS
jgi:hypothetical protein